MPKNVSSFWKCKISNNNPRKLNCNFTGAGGKRTTLWNLTFQTCPSQAYPMKPSPSARHRCLDRAHSKPVSCLVAPSAFIQRICRANTPTRRSQTESFSTPAEWMRLSANTMSLKNIPRLRPCGKPTTLCNLTFQTFPFHACMIKPSPSSLHFRRSHTHGNPIHQLLRLHRPRLLTSSGGYGDAIGSGAIEKWWAISYGWATDLLEVFRALNQKREAVAHSIMNAGRNHKVSVATASMLYEEMGASSTSPSLTYATHWMNKRRYIPVRPRSIQLLPSCKLADRF